MADIDPKIPARSETPAVTTGPIRGSRKVHVGPLNVAMRQVAIGSPRECDRRHLSGRAKAAKIYRLHFVIDFPGVPPARLHQDSAYEMGLARRAFLDERRLLMVGGDPNAEQLGAGISHSPKTSEVNRTCRVMKHRGACRSNIAANNCTAHLTPTTQVKRRTRKSHGVLPGSYRHLVCTSPQWAHAHQYQLNK